MLGKRGDLLLEQLILEDRLIQRLALEDRRHRALALGASAASATSPASTPAAAAALTLVLGAFAFAHIGRTELDDGAVLDGLECLVVLAVRGARKALPGQHDEVAAFRDRDLRATTSCASPFAALAPVALPSATPGAGLGLSLLESHVKAHGGRVTVKTRPGEGTAFTLHLPAVAASSGGANNGVIGGDAE